MSAPQSVLDALADAETLRLFLLPYTGKGAFRMPLPTAGSYLREIRTVLLHRGLNATSARMAASLAFRACPGLRG